jgi:hypothetical protein
MAQAPTTVKVHLDASELEQAIEDLPDEVLDRLADRLADRIERRLLQQRRLRGDA